jgi:hypothetical protein
VSPLERLLAETIPLRPEPAPDPSPWTQRQQDDHWRALCRAVGTPDAQRPTRHENSHQNAA